MIYCIDSSAWIDCWRRWYPINTFPSMWSNFAGLIDQQRLLTPLMVLDELEAVEDGIAPWIKQRPHGVYDVDEAVQQGVRMVMARFPKLVEPRGKSSGDPWVIATAHVLRGVVVTGEKRTGGGETPRIPNVCDSLGINVIGTLEFICCHGWQF